MVARTRSATNSPTKPTSKSRPTVLDHWDPLKLLILPKNLCPTARLIFLRDPQDYSRKRYLFCPVQGLFEFKKLSTSTLDPRSTLLCGSEEPRQVKDRSDHESTPDLRDLDISQGFVNKNAELLIASPFDLAFVLLSSLFPNERNSKTSLFQPLDDLLEAQVGAEKHLEYVLHHGRQLIEQTMSRLCDIVDAGDEQMYRLNEEKIMSLLLEKSKKAIVNGLPSSLEEKFVTRALEVPVLSVKRQESNIGTTGDDSLTKKTESTADTTESQSSSVSTAPSTIFSSASSTISVNTADSDVSSGILELQRLRVAFNFITSSYLPADIASQFQERLASQKSHIDFEPLNSHLKYLTSLQSEALASRSMGDFSRKRSSIEDDEAIEDRAEKRRKQEEEDKRKKAAESRGVRDLKKVNVAGMKKMSDFFGKKPAQKVAS